MYIRRLVGSENVWFPSKSHSICNGKDQSIKLLKLKRITDRAAVNSENVKVIKNQELMKYTIRSIVCEASCYPVIPVI